VSAHAENADPVDFEQEHSIRGKFSRENSAARDKLFAKRMVNLQGAHRRRCEPAIQPWKKT
jgi:hypothetical protein